jgi:hypothetical protein
MIQATREDRSTAVSPTATRKFTLIDAMVLVAATALSLVMIRDYLNNERFRRILSLPGDWRMSTLWLHGCAYVGVLSPLAVALSLALFILCLRKPRPEMRLLLRQPGMVASCGTVIAGSLFVLKVFFSSLAVDRPWGLVRLYDIWMMRLPWSAEVVAAAWILLWLSGNWQSEASWIDRAGRALGVYWVVTGIFFNYVLYYC